MLGDTGREDDVAQIRLVFDRRVSSTLGSRIAVSCVATTLEGSSRSMIDQ